MFNTKLTHAVENFAALILPLSEKDLEREWIWKDHDKEGIRFACFVTLQELRHLAVELSALRPGGRLPSISSANTTPPIWICKPRSLGSQKNMQIKSRQKVNGR
jgi:hypothetical protein